MKKIIFFFLLPLYIFSIERYSLNGIEVIYQRENAPYDYVSLIADKGYQDGSEFEMLGALMDYVSKENIFSLMKVYPDYTVIEFYSNKMNAMEILLNIRRAFDGKPEKINYSGYDLFDIAIIERWGYFADFGIKKTSESVYEALKNAEIKLFIKTSSEKAEINGILKGFNSFKRVEKAKKNRNELYGNYSMLNIPSDILFYDFHGLKDYNLHMYILLMHSLNFNSPVSDIRSSGGKMFLVTTASLESAIKESTFIESKERLLESIKIASENASEAVFRFGFIFTENSKFSMDILRKKTEKAKYEDFIKFISSLKPSVKFIKSKDKEEKTGYDATELKNGVTLLYRNKNETGTEISVAVYGILSVEKEYSKLLASDMVFRDFEERFPEWRPMTPFLRSDIRVYSIKTSEDKSVSKIFELLSLGFKVNIASIRNADNARNVLNSYNQLQFHLGRQEDVDSSFILLTDGEYRILANNIFSGKNIIVVVESSVQKEKFKDAIESVKLFKTSMPKLEKSPYENGESYISYILNSDKIYMDENTRLYFPNTLQMPMTNKGQKYYYLSKSNLYSMAAAISFILYSDPQKLPLLLR